MEQHERRGKCVEFNFKKVFKLRCFTVSVSSWHKTQKEQGKVGIQNDVVLLQKHGRMPHLCNISIFSLYLKIETLWFNMLQSIVSVHWREEGCIGKYTPRGPRDFPRAEGCKIPAQGNSRGSRGCIF